MAHESPLSYVFQCSYQDVDDLADQARHWDLDFRQIERGRFHGDILQFAAGGVHISDARFRRSLIQRGAPPAGMRTIAVPARRDLRLEWRGRSIDGDSLMLFPLGSELASISRPDFHVYTCSFPVGLLSSAGEELGLGEIDSLSGGAEAIRVPRAAMDSLRVSLSQICRNARMSPDRLPGCTIAEELTQGLPTRLLTAIAAARGRCPGTVCPTRQEAMSRAETYIEANALSDIKVSDICRAAGVSERTLQYAFTESFGIGPKEYLHTLRLIEVRRHLRTADSRKTKVADVANAAGFWHMGQFAADYRRRFEELPSETLRRSTANLIEDMENRSRGVRRGVGGDH